MWALAYTHSAGARPATLELAGTVPVFDFAPATELLDGPH
jgi:hypothetical protein